MAVSHSVPCTKGYPCNIFHDSLNDKHKCNLCDQGLRNPVQTSCGHRYCRCCHQVLTGHSHQAFCKGCTKDGSGEVVLNNTEIFPDNAISREMSKFSVQCINDGCDWNGKLKAYENHEKACDHEMIRCVHKECGINVKRKDLTEHLNKHCPMRRISCKYCRQEFPQKHLQQHQSECDAYPIECKFCRAATLPRKEMKSHQDPLRGTCTRKLKVCHYNTIGCTALIEEEKTHEHNQEYLHYHQDLLRDRVLEVKPVIKDIEEGKAMINNLDQQIKRHEHVLQELEQRFRSLQEKFSKLQQDSSADHKDTNVGQIETSLKFYDAKVNELKKKFSVLETKVTTYEGVVSVLNAQIERDSQNIQSSERQRRRDRELLESLERKIKAQDRIIALKDVALAEQDLRIQALEMSSYDGCLVWKISDFTKKLQEAMSGKTTSVYSPCFFTSRHGYKMCARIYLNGDGMGKGNHVSLFFVIMKGPFDALLRWPFRQKVTFMWLDQNNREHVIDAFRPDPTSSSFQRPKNDMNIASGCPLFMPLSQIDSSRHAYVKDDTAFLKIIVDTSDFG